MNNNLYLSQAQLNAEVNRCLNCKNHPCMTACPIHCNPQEFIQFAKSGNYEGAVESISEANPMGQTCGLICPDKFCMKACTRSHLDFPINIPKVQASIMEKHHHASSITNACASNGHKVAIIGAGPAGISACSTLLKSGFDVVMYEATDKVGGALNLIPENRLPAEVINKEWNFIRQNPRLQVNFNTAINDAQSLLDSGFEYIIIASGEPNIINLGIDGEDLAVSYVDYLRNPEKYITDGDVAIIGGGAVATDCALTARYNGAQNVEMFIRRRISDMRITHEERKSLLENGIDLTSMTKIKKISADQNKLTLYTCKTHFVNGKLEEIADTTIKRPDFSLIVKAIGSSAPHFEDTDRIIYAGDCKTGGSTIVEALASGKSAAEKILSLY